ncbi:MAG: ATP-grasp domain-containing protein [Methylophaga sp.]|nr:ATP-grasp domain-containing protein [Methylophaga sp.]
MKLFVYEHITSGALINESLPTSLAHEGNNMLLALINDLFQLPNLELIILRDARLIPLPDVTNYHQCHTVHTAEDFDHYYALALNDADAMLPIAPETDNTLSKVQQSVLDNNKQLLASPPATSKLCSDKYRCYQYLHTHNVASPQTCLADNWSHQTMSSTTGYIVKPRDGAGCVDTLFFPYTSTLEMWLAKQSTALDTLIVQPYIEGHHISLNLLCSDNDCMVLAINEQHIKMKNDQLFFAGSTVNGVSENQLNFSDASELATQVHQAITGLWGFVGIDLIVSKNAILVIDINPRLTSSYVGLANSLTHNPTELLFSMMEHNKLPLTTPLQRRPVEVRL